MGVDSLEKYVVKGNRFGEWATLRIPKKIANELIVEHNIDLTNTGTCFFTDLLKELKSKKEKK